MDDLKSKHQTTIDAQGDIIAGSIWVCGAAEITAQGGLTAEKLYFWSEAAQVAHDMRVTAAGNVSIDEMAITYSDFYLASTGGNIEVDAYYVYITGISGQFAIEAPAGLRDSALRRRLQPIRADAGAHSPVTGQLRASTRAGTSTFPRTARST